jgi:hypothetical protein
MPDSRKGVAKELKRVSQRGYRAKAIPQRIKDEPVPRPVPPGRGQPAPPPVSLR